MRKILKLICILSAMMIFVSAETVGAEVYDSVSAVEMLEALQIYPLEKSEGMTKDFVISSMLGLHYDDRSILDTESAARTLGMIDAGTIYNGNSGVSYDEAIKYAVCILGYRTQAEYSGGFEKMAVSLGLTEGLKYKESITLSDLTRLIYNMLEVEPIALDINGNDYELLSGETLLSRYRDIYKINGIQTADEKTSIYSSDGCGEDEIQIDGVNYGEAAINENLLGKNVTAYVKITNNSSEILYLAENADRNEVLTLDSECIIDIPDDYSYISYEDSSIRERKAKLDGAPKVIFNGVFYGDYKKSDLMPDTGSVELVDNNGDGKYDVISIISYETVIVKGKDILNNIIYNKFNIDGYIYDIALEEKGTDVDYKIYKDGNEIKFSDIQNGNVLNVAMNKDKDRKHIEIIVSDKKISGNVTKMSSERDEITVDGEVYTVSEDFERFRLADGKTLSLGGEYTFYIDSFGQAVYFEYGIKSEYVVLFRTYVSEDAEESYGIEYLDLEGQWKITEFSKKVDTGAKQKLDSENAYLSLKGVKGEIVLVKYDNTGRIKSVKRAEETTEVDEDRFTKTPAEKLTWRSSPRTFQNKIYIEDDTKLALIPDDVTDRDSYSVMDASAYLTGDTSFTISAYDIDKYGFTGLLSIKGGTAKVGNSWFIVTKLMDIYADGEVYQQAVGNTGVYRDYNAIGKEGVFDSVSPGDIIKISVRNDGVVDKMEKKYSMNNEFIPSYASNYYVSESIVAGTVEDIDSDKGRILLDCGGEKVSFRIGSSIGVQSYSVSDKTCDLISINGILEGDQVICRVSYSAVTNIIIRKK